MQKFINYSNRHLDISPFTVFSQRGCKFNANFIIFNPHFLVF